MKPRIQRLPWLMVMLLLAIPALGPLVVAQSAQETVYRDPQQRFQLAVPAGWTAAPSEYGVQLSRGEAFVTILVMEGDTGGWNSAEQVVRQIGSQWREFHQTQRGDSLLGGLPATVAFYQGVNPRNKPAQMKVIAVPAPGRTIVLLMSMPQELATRSMAGEFDAIEHGLSLQDGPNSGYIPPVAGPAGGAAPASGSLPSPNRAILGVNCRAITPEDMAQFGITTMQGVLVGAVMPGGPAERAGLRPGDVITTVGGQPVQSGPELVQAVGRYNPGDTIELLVLQHGRPASLQVQLAGRTDAQGAIPPVAPPAVPSPPAGPIAPPPPAGPATMPAAVPASRLTPPSFILKPYRGNGFTVSVPSNWSATPTASGNTTYFAAGDGLRRNENGITTIMLGLMIGWQPAENGDPRQAVDKNVEDLLSLNPGTRALSREQIAIGGSPAVRLLLDGRNTYTGEPERSWLVETVRGRQLVFFSLTAPAGDYESVRDTFDRIIASIQLTGGGY